MPASLGLGLRHLGVLDVFGPRGRGRFGDMHRPAADKRTADR
ncbi:MAG: hypothetical protein ACTHLU_10400 [Novosphingobium sp.]